MGTQGKPQKKEEGNKNDFQQHVLAALLVAYLDIHLVFIRASTCSSYVCVCVCELKFCYVPCLILLLTRRRRRHLQLAGSTHRVPITRRIRNVAKVFRLHLKLAVLC